MLREINSWPRPGEFYESDKSSALRIYPRIRANGERFYLVLRGQSFAMNHTRTHRVTFALVEASFALPCLIKLSIKSYVRENPRERRFHGCHRHFASFLIARSNVSSVQLPSYLYELSNDLYAPGLFILKFIRNRDEITAETGLRVRCRFITVKSCNQAS